MPPHGEYLEVPLSPGNHKTSSPRLSDLTSVTEITTPTCAVCGKAGVSICTKCSKGGRSYKAALARSNPLQERDPETYKRLDELSRLPLKGNKQLWDEFCIEIKAGDFYEYLPILVEIVHEGKWRTNALDAKGWLRGHFARRAKRVSAPEDYSPTGRRRPVGPKFDKRSGALIAFVTRPFAEFEVLGEYGFAISAEEVIDRKRLQTVADDDGYEVVVMPADRESLRFLGRQTLAEYCEAFRCLQMVDALKHDRPTFDRALASAITGQQWLVGQIGLDQDEAEVLAVSILLWNVGPRMYLNFLDKANKRRMRNAWDRLGRRMQDPDFRRDLRCLLRRHSEHEDLSVTAKQASSIKHEGIFGIATNEERRL
jgi:hypothetical protein